MMLLLASAAHAGGLTDAAEYRLIVALPPAMVVDADGDTIGQTWSLDQRLRLGIDYVGKDWHLGTEWDLGTGQIAGDTWDIPGAEDERERWELGGFTLDGIRPRKVAVGVDTPVARFDVGLMTSRWGLGMVANDGATDPVFGRDDFGDRVIRARLATRVGKSTTLVLAGDIVAADDTADLAQDQVATQVVAAALAGAPSTGVAGIYGVYRHQVDDGYVDGPRVTNVGVLDAYGQVRRPVGTWSVDLAAEAAGIVGRTTRATNYNARDGLVIESGGAVAQAHFHAPADRVSVLLRGGVASGDDDGEDGVSHAFSFDRDFDVGMVLFDEIQGALDAEAYAQVTDTTYAAEAPDGADSLVGEGAFRAATFLAPTLEIRPMKFVEGRLGAMTAFATAPIAQPFETFRNGGVPSNHLGVATTGRYLGTEIDWAVIVGDTAAPGGRAFVEPKLRPSLVVQGGHAFLSPDLGGGGVDLVLVEGRLRL